MKANESESLNDNNEVNFATNRVEELWTELSHAWPAVKNNPEIAEKIEQLWNILKTSNSDQLDISEEIKNILGNNNIDTTFEASPTISSNNSINTPDKVSGLVKHTSKTLQDNDDLDSLLSDILGENYKQELNDSPVQTTAYENKTEETANGSGTEELDKLVASILGEDWLKDETSIPPSTDEHPITDIDENSDLNFKIDRNIDHLVTSIISDDTDKNTIEPSSSKIDVEVQDITDDKLTIDKLLNDILTEDKLEEELTTNNDNSDESMDTLIHDVINDEYENTYSSLNISSNEEESPITNSEENIDNLINDILSKDSNLDNTEVNISDTANLEQAQTLINKPEENIDNLINDILSKDSNSENTEFNTSDTVNLEQTQTAINKPEENIDDIINNDTKTENDSDVQEHTKITNDEEKEDIDKLINEIINKDDKSENITEEEQTQTTGTNQEENIDDLIQDILANKTTDNIDDSTLNIADESTITTNDTPYKKEKSSTVNKISTVPNNDKPETTSTKETKKESSNALTMIILIILIFGLIGTWQLFFTNDEIILADKTTSESYTNITSNIEEDDSIIEGTTEDKYTAPTTEEYSYKPKQEYSLPNIEETTSYSASDYAAQIETNDNDITIMLNTPETAIDSTIDSIVSTETEETSTTIIEPVVDDSVNKEENIIDSTPPVETLSNNEPIIEKVKIIPPVKTKPKRNVIVHKIVKGDTLWAIAKRYVNNPYRYPELARLSKIKNPNRIYPGNKVRIIIYTK